MSQVQLFTVDCESCGEKLEKRMTNVTERKEIPIKMVVDGMDFECDCGEITCVEVLTFNA